MYYIQYVNKCIEDDAFDTNISLTENNEQLLQCVENNINNMCTSTVYELIHAVSLLLSHKYISTLYANDETYSLHQYMIVDFDILNMLLNVAKNDEQRMYVFNSVFSIIIVKLMLYLNILTNKFI